MALTARIVKDAHRIEKGLALPEPKPWFGEAVIERLVVNVERLPSQDSDEVRHARSMATAAVGAYFEAFDNSDHTAPGWTDGVRRRLMSEPNHTAGGVKPASREVQDPVESINEFLQSRESIRNFSDKQVAVDDLRSAADIAAQSPSVCNRQGTVVTCFPRGQEANRLLKHQNGNSGFGDRASHILLITHDLSVMMTAGERNQAFVDGGLYAMTLIYALQARGIGSCCLNWSSTASQDAALRAELKLPPEHVVIMMIAIGYPAEGCTVAVSSTRQGRFAYAT